MAFVGESCPNELTSWTSWRTNAVSDGEIVVSDVCGVIRIGHIAAGLTGSIHWACASETARVAGLASAIVCLLIHAN